MVLWQRLGDTTAARRSHGAEVATTMATVAAATGHHSSARCDSLQQPCAAYRSSSTLFKQQCMRCLLQ
ncbi:Hypothetical predicted protein [Olea europaea subsp. europaea]|uniref:Uncharacterized protein n=1 Tax=Olea europaea subsp. europaea TaxID=158383 RepID=A0A8S0V2C4_OLEEU|nr:Hypothetical predicted protein [Olea europaea subsp. europaea]